jgi:hypothetical protein
MYTSPAVVICGHQFGEAERRRGTRGDGENTLVRVPTNFTVQHTLITLQSSLLSGILFVFCLYDS